MANHPQCEPSANRVAIITGGSRGVGHQVARKLAGQGDAVVISYAANQSDADAAVTQILDSRGVALAVRADVADELDVERLFDETSRAFGGIDVVVHAAARRMLCPLSECDHDTFDAMRRTNLRGMVMINQQAARELRDGGAIVNVSFGSAAALARPPYAGYVAGKDPVESITQALARELCERDITVNAVALRVEAPGSAANIANLVVFLASQDGHSVTGQLIRASEGIT